MNEDWRSRTEPIALPPPALSRRQVWLIVAGFPALYLLNSFTPWSMGLFRDGDQSWWPAFFVSVAVLHWMSVFAVVWTMRRNRQELRQIGFRMRVPGMLAYFVVVIAVGVGLVLLRQTWPPPESPLEPWAILYPVTLGQKIAWIGISLTAGFCEEFVYRGFAIRALQGRGFRTWQAVALASVSFTLLHGIAGVILFPVYFAFGLLFAGLFLWTKRLAPVMYAHALFDVLAVLAV
ncbi:MAG: CPBP family intramembrane metalloprotease [Planctomycetota bacterium]|nr:CPBP family intramembrane metalloprotease [Planctomycetaceae bacterium]MDQ3332752.1 CPBP family intramembrane metalloprotease [Planctomycetota bacterium]